MEEPRSSLIIYDGDCIYCQNYVRFVRLRETVGPVELLDARSDDPRVQRYWHEGLNLDEGMLFVHRGQVYYGAEAVQILATLSSENTFLNRLNRWVFSGPATARAIYPILKLGRRVTLWVRGRGPVTPASNPSP